MQFGLRRPLGASVMVNVAVARVLAWIFGS